MSAYRDILHKDDVERDDMCTDEVCCNNTQDSCQSKLATVERQYAYLLSDFENYKRRVEGERVRSVWHVKARILKDVLEVLQNVDRALVYASQTGVSQSQEMMQGIELIQKSGKKLLEKHGIAPVSQVETFDPAIHEALAYVPAAGKQPGSIVEVLEKGYFLDGELLKPVLVSVAQAQAEPDTTQDKSQA